MKNITEKISAIADMTALNALPILRHRETMITCGDSLKAFIKKISDWTFRLKSLTATAADQARFLSFAKSVLLSSAVNSMISILAVSARNIRAKIFRITNILMFEYKNE